MGFSIYRIILPKLISFAKFLLRTNRFLYNIIEYKRNYNHLLIRNNMQKAY